MFDMFKMDNGSITYPSKDKIHERLVLDMARDLDGKVREALIKMGWTPPSVSSEPAVNEEERDLNINRNLYNKEDVPASGIIHCACPMMVVIATVCHYSTEPWNELPSSVWDSPAGRHIRFTLYQNGIIDARHSTTAKGKAWIAALVSTPWPVKHETWIVKRTES